MGSISITKQYSELDEYTQIKEYIEKVLDNFDSMDNLDSNDIYEIVYARKLCDNKLKQGIENSGTRAAFEDTSTRLDLIINLLNDDIIDKALSNHIDKSKISKVETSKLAKSNKLPELQDRSNPKFSSPIQEYCKRMLVKLIILSVPLFCMLNGQDLGEIVADTIYNLMTVGKTTAEQTVAQGEQMLETTKHMSSIIGVLGRLLTTIIISATSISMMIDLLYISVPAFRYMIDERKGRLGSNEASLVSSYAVESVEMEGNIIGYHTYSSSNKADTAKVLLDNMTSSLMSIKSSGKSSDDDEAHLFNIIRMRNRLNDCKDKYERIKYLADVEIYYVNNKKYFDSILKED